MKPSRKLTGEDGRYPVGGRGLTLVEVLIAMIIMAVGVLGTLGMFHTGYNTVGAGGRKTMALTAARQMLEDVRMIPFANLPNLDGFNTNSSSTLPSNDPERTIAQKWRYALAGEGAGWGITPTQMAQWGRLSSGAGEGVAISGSGQITVTTLGTPPTMRQVNVTVWVPAVGGSPVILSTRISRP